MRRVLRTAALIAVIGGPLWARQRAWERALRDHARKVHDGFAERDRQIVKWTDEVVAQIRKVLRGGPPFGGRFELVITNWDDGEGRIRRVEESG